MGAIAPKGQQNIAQGSALGKRIPPPKLQRPERAAEYTKVNALGIVAPHAASLKGKRTVARKLYYKTSFPKNETTQHPQYILFPTFLTIILLFFLPLHYLLTPNKRTQ